MQLNSKAAPKHIIFGWLFNISHLSDRQWPSVDAMIINVTAESKNM